MSILDTPSPFYSPEKISNWQLAIRYGAIWAVTGFILSLVGFLTDTDASMPTTATSIKILYGVISLCVATWCIRTAIIQDRDGQLSGFIDYGRACMLGVKVGLIAGATGSLLQLLYTRAINTGYQETMVDALRDQFESQGMSDDQIERALYISNLFSGPFATIIIFIIIALFFALIISLIAAAVLKKSSYDTQ